MDVGFRTEPYLCVKKKRRPRNGAERGGALEHMRTHYKEWARSSKLPHAERVADKLWTSQTLLPKTGQYPSVSSKVMKGAATRPLIG